VIRKRLILSLLGLFLGSRGLTVAQAPMRQSVVSEEHGAAMLARLRPTFIPPQVPLLLRSEDHEKSAARFIVEPAGAYARGLDLKDLTVGDIKTRFFTQSSMPLLQFLGGRFRINAFQSSFHIANAQLNVFGNCGLQKSLLPHQSYPRNPCSVDLSGLSLNFLFGRDARTESATQPWRGLLRMAGAILD
jgi:hypothetical protein